MKCKLNTPHQMKIKGGTSAWIENVEKDVVLKPSSKIIVLTALAYISMLE
jgi:hypothetical protein